MDKVSFHDILYVVLTVVVPVVAVYLRQLIMTKINGTKYERAVEAVLDAVEYVQQTFVDSLKKSGNFDTEAQQLAFERAKDAAIERMDEGTKKLIDKLYGGLDAWLKVQIEASVRGIK